MTQEDKVFNPGKAAWVQHTANQSLDDDQQALLLALAQLEAEMGRDLSDDERTAIQSLADQLEGFDPDEIKAAIHEMVTQPADPERQTSWPEIKKQRP